MDAISSVSGLIRPGDLIDIYVSFDDRQRRVTAPLLQSVLVLVTGQKSGEGVATTRLDKDAYSTLTLDVGPDDALKLLAARQHGRISALLRNPDDHTPHQAAVRGELADILGLGQGMSPQAACAGSVRESPRWPSQSSGAGAFGLVGYARQFFDGAAAMSKTRYRLYRAALGLSSAALFGLSMQSQAQGLALQVGELLVLPDTHVERVAVGDGDIVHAVTTESGELILFARKAGSTVVQVWSSSGQNQSYQLEVSPENHRQTVAELKSLLERIPELRVSELGGKLVLEGEGLSDQDKQRIQSLSQEHPQLLDFTQQDGWEPMVLLDVQVVEVPRNSLRELRGALGWEFSRWLEYGRWLGRSDTSISGSPRGRKFLPLAFPARQGAAFFGVGALMSARVQAMAQEGHAVVLAQPQLLARSGSQAEFLAGEESPYTTTDDKGNSKTSFKPYGVSLRIVPRVERGGLVRSKIEVEVSSVDASLSQPAGPSLNASGFNRVQCAFGADFGAGRIYFA